MKLITVEPKKRPRVTKRIIRRTIRTVDGGEPQVTETVEEVPLDSDDDIEEVIRTGAPIVSRKIIRRVVKKTNGVDREVTKTVTWIKPDGSESTEVIDLSRSSMSTDVRPRTSIGDYFRKSGKSVDGGARDGQSDAHNWS
jgi:hypothetical protein